MSIFPYLKSEVADQWHDDDKCGTYCLFISLLAVFMASTATIVLRKFSVAIAVLPRCRP